MKYFARLNNYQYGAYPFTMLHQYIYREEKLDEHHRVVFVEIPEKKQNTFRFVATNIAGALRGKRQIIKPFPSRFVDEDKIIQLIKEGRNF